MNLKKELLKLSEKISAIAKTVDKMATVVNGMGQSAPKPVKVKPAQKKVAKKPAVKKAVAKKPAAKKETKEKPAVKKSDKVTAIDTVFGIIKESKNGINTAGLMTKTGFNAKKVQNLVAKLKKKGQIKTVGRGVYGVL